MSKIKILVIFVVGVVFYFFGSFFASHVLFPLVAIGVTAGTFYFFRKSSKKRALFFSLIMAVLSVVVWTQGFEESYCWEKGWEADSTGSQLSVATEENARALSEWGVQEGDTIGVSFSAHMLCHTTFEFFKVVKERYLWQ